MQDGDMMEAPRSAGGGSSKTPLIAGFVLLLVAVAAGWFVLNRGGGLGGAPIKKVASIDSDAIYQLKEFTDARDMLQKKSDAFRKELEEKTAKLPRGTDAEKAESMRKVQEMASEYEQQLQQLQNKTLRPLQTKAEAAIASVARQKNYKVVLDKRIVVYGVEDITEDVKKLFQDKAELKLPAEDDTKDSPIAYFDQEVVRNLKAFQEVDLKLATMKNDLGREFQERSQGKSEQEKANMQKELMLRLQAKQEEEIAPLIQAVNQSVSEAAEKNNVALVLDKVHVMYGGRNLTDEVVDTFLKKTGSKPSTEGDDTGDKPTKP